jgi:hypothetical protein
MNLLRKGTTMLKQSTNFYPRQIGESALAASRQVWLAGLGATAVTREWVQGEAGHVFKRLVKEGNVVEANAVRVINERIGPSIARANTAWRQTRRTVETTVKQAAAAAVDYAERVLPKSLPKVHVATAPKPAAAAKRRVKAVRARTTKTVRKARRAAK